MLVIIVCCASPILTIFLYTAWFFGTCCNRFDPQFCLMGYSGVNCRMGSTKGSTLTYNSNNFMSDEYTNTNAMKMTVYKVIPCIFIVSKCEKRTPWVTETRCVCLKIGANVRSDNHEWLQLASLVALDTFLWYFCWSAWADTLCWWWRWGWCVWGFLATQHSPPHFPNLPQLPFYWHGLLKCHLEDRGAGYLIHWKAPVCQLEIVKVF